MTLPVKEDERQPVEVDVWVDGTFIAEEVALELPNILREEFGTRFSRKAAYIRGSDCWKAWEMACDRLSAEMETEEGDDNAEVKEDDDVETDVVEGADSLLVDEAGLGGSNEAEMLLSILRDVFEDKP